MLRIGVILTAVVSSRLQLGCLGEGQPEPITKGNPDHRHRPVVVGVPLLVVALV